MAERARTNILVEKPFTEKLGILIGVLVPPLATVYAIYTLWERYVSALDLALFAAFYLISGLGVTIGFHRMLAHRSFETSPALKALLLIMGTMSVQGNPIAWASTHIEHHANSDSEDDPHSPLVSLWHAHVGWIFGHRAQLDKYGSWLLKDSVVVWVDRWWVLWVALGLAIPFVIGGWSGLLWGGLVRIFIVHHGTWSVNSICHTFGTRPFATRDLSRNNGWVGIIALGEGWHNNHHAFPRSAFHGLRWWQVDVSGYVIRVLEAGHLVWNVQRIRLQDQLKRRSVTLE